jgi:hypothetical protein
MGWAAALQVNRSTGQKGNRWTRQEASKAAGQQAVGQLVDKAAQQLVRWQFTLHTCLYTAHSKLLNLLQVWGRATTAMGLLEQVRGGGGGGGRGGAKARWMVEVGWARDCWKGKGGELTVLTLVARLRRCCCCCRRCSLQPGPPTAAACTGCGVGPVTLS